MLISKLFGDDDEEGQGDAKVSDVEGKMDAALAYVRHLQSLADLYRQVCWFLVVADIQDYFNFSIPN